MSLEDLSGSTLGHYRVGDRIGEGAGSAVYRATDLPSERLVALKALDPEINARPDFVSWLTDQTTAVSATGHRRLVPVYEVGSRSDLVYLVMRLFPGGTVRHLVARGPLDLYPARRIVHDVAGAIHAAHEVGVVHGDIKPSNVLIDTDGSAHLADFALLGQGPAWGTPGYMAPEQARGIPVDSRSDVHGLAALLFHMVTGGPVYRGDTAAQRLAATISQPVPSARRLNPALPPELNQMLFQALAKDPSHRPQTVDEFLDGLNAVPWGPPTTEDWAENQLGALIDASLDMAMAIDGAGRITAWNGRAEKLLGWPRAEMIGEPILTRLVAPRHREMFERLLLTLSTRRLPEGQTVEVMVVNSEGRQVMLEASISPFELDGSGGGLVMFCREETGRASTAVMVDEGEPPTDRQLSILAGRACRALHLDAAALWVPTSDPWLLRRRAFWHGLGRDPEEREMLGPGVQEVQELGLAGKALTLRETVWRTDLVPTPAERERAGASGLVTRGAVPILDEDRSPLGVLEFLNTVPATGEPMTPEAVDAAVEPLVPALRRLRPTRPRLTHFRLDPKNSHVTFSCSFMRFMTVRGLFHEFHGWVEVQDLDPTTAVAECTIKAASVDTGGMDRDFHICSPDFFAVERFPDITFRSHRVQAVGDERFRVLGDLTIRNVTKPVRLQVQLEDTEMESSQVARMTLTASTVIDRTDWVLDWEKALQAGRWIVGNQVRLDLVIALERRHRVDESAP
ncbi:MAG TPA: YceI family protein [Candidatus Dormibacteraeota bacterium]|nr:YceI family protein [Candidatus Dormibacteraeota bacterium]